MWKNHSLCLTWDNICKKACIQTFIWNNIIVGSAGAAAWWHASAVLLLLDVSTWAASIVQVSFIIVYHYVLNWAQLFRACLERRNFTGISSISQEKRRNGEKIPHSKHALNCLLHKILECSHLIMNTSFYAKVHNYAKCVCCSALSVFQLAC